MIIYRGVKWEASYALCRYIVGDEMTGSLTKQLREMGGNQFNFIIYSLHAT